MAPSRQLRAGPGFIWVALLAAICVTQIIRGETVGALVYAAAAVLVAADVLHVLPTGRIRRRPSSRTLAVIAAVIAVVLCLLPPHGDLTQTILLVLLAATIVLSWPGSHTTGDSAADDPDAGLSAADDPTQPWPAGLRTLAIAWTAIIVAGFAFEITEFTLGRIHPHSTDYTLSDILDPVASRPLGRAVLTCAWLALGWFLLNRGHHDGGHNTRGHHGEQHR